MTTRDARLLAVVCEKVGEIAPYLYPHRDGFDERPDRNLATWVFLNLRPCDWGRWGDRSKWLDGCLLKTDGFWTWDDPTDAELVKVVETVTGQVIDC